MKKHLWHLARYFFWITVAYLAAQFICWAAGEPYSIGVTAFVLAGFAWLDANDK